MRRSTERLSRETVEAEVPRVCQVALRNIRKSIEIAERSRYSCEHTESLRMAISISDMASRQEQIDRHDNECQDILDGLHARQALPCGRKSGLLVTPMRRAPKALNPNKTTKGASHD